MLFNRSHFINRLRTMYVGIVGQFCGQSMLGRLQPKNLMPYCRVSTVGYMSINVAATATHSQRSARSLCQKYDYVNIRYTNRKTFQQCVTMAEIKKTHSGHNRDTRHLSGVQPTRNGFAKNDTKRKDRSCMNAHFRGNKNVGGHATYMNICNFTDSGKSW